MEHVILVDEQDQEIGIMEKQNAHIEGRLHRAISLFIFNTKGELLLQQRALGKYHSANLWTNTCCSHPRPGEEIYDAAIRRLYEEMGIKCAIERAFSFVYKANLDNNLIEHELDHVFTGITDSIPNPDPNEVSLWQYISPKTLMASVKTHPEEYTEWFKICLKNNYSQLFDKKMKHENI